MRLGRRLLEQRERRTQRALKAAKRRAAKRLGEFCFHFWVGVCQVVGLCGLGFRGLEGCMCKQDGRA